MSDTLIRIRDMDLRENAQVDALLQQEGIRRDRNLDYTCGIFDDDWRLVATGSCFGNTIRCLAVSKERRGEGLLNQIISHLTQVHMQRGNRHLFLYTKPESARIMSDLGYYEIARVDQKLVFMENRRNGFAKYCADLSKTSRGGPRIAGIVMNANPFTNGHLYLVERAARENDEVHLFVLSEEVGPIPFGVRKRLVKDGVQHLDNVICHDSGPYIISSATFPSYFLKDGDAVIETQATLDLQVFGKISKSLGIQRRYVGQELNSRVTALYNKIMMDRLPKQGVECVEISRITSGDQVISASAVRRAVHDNRLEEIREFLPRSTYEFFASDEGKKISAAIRAEENVMHY